MAFDVIASESFGFLFCYLLRLFLNPLLGYSYYILKNFLNFVKIICKDVSISVKNMMLIGDDIYPPRNDIEVYSPNPDTFV